MNADEPNAACDGCDRLVPHDELTVCTHHEPDGTPDTYRFCTNCIKDTR